MNASKYFWDKWNSTAVGLYLREFEERWIKLAFHKNKNIRSVLDVGCGSGQFSIPIYKKGINVVALEYDKNALLELKGKEEAIPILLGDGKKLPFRNQSFDCMLCIQAVDYIDKEKFFFFAECYSVLKDNGLLIFTSSNKNSYKRVVTRLFTRIGYNPYAHLQSIKNDPPPFMDLKNLRQKLNNSGFTVEKISGYYWLPASRYNTSKVVNNYSFVSFFTLLERMFRLDALHSISPWFFIIARKSTNEKGRLN